MEKIGKEGEKVGKEGKDGGEGLKGDIVHGNKGRREKRETSLAIKRKGKEKVKREKPGREGGKTGRASGSMQMRK